MAARKPYMWAVDPLTDGAGGMLFARLLTVVDGCIAPDPTRRLTVPHVLDTLTALQRDVSGAVPSTAAAGGGAGGSSVFVSPPPLPMAKSTTAATPTYDVLAIVNALEALAIDTAAVIDAIGGMTLSSLDTLRTAGVPYSKCVKVKQALANDVATTDVATTVCVCVLVAGGTSSIYPTLLVCELICERFIGWSLVQLDVAAVLDALAAQGCEEDKLDALGERIGFADTVTVEQLAAAGFTNRVVFDLRRRLDPHFATTQRKQVADATAAAALAAAEADREHAERVAQAKHQAAAVEVSAAAEGAAKAVRRCRCSCGYRSRCHALQKCSCTLDFPRCMQCAVTG